MFATEEWEGERVPAGLEDGVLYPALRHPSHRHRLALPASRRERRRHRLFVFRLDRALNSDVNETMKQYKNVQIGKFWLPCLYVCILW